MKKIRIAIIDSGVKKEHPRLIHDDIKGFTFRPEGIMEDFSDTYGHGTAIYNIVRKLENAEIINIKIPNIEEGVADENIISLLNYIYEKVDVDIINLSLGLSMTDNINALYDACEKLRKKGIILISAFDNTGSMSYPAAFDNVIGVTTGEMCRNTDEYDYLEDNIVNIAGYGNIQRLAWTEPDYLIIGGNSFACAHITVKVANLMEAGAKTYEEVMQMLKQDATRYFEVSEQKKESGLPYQIKKAAIFPFNKEMHSLVRYEYLLGFELTGVYDVKYSGKIGADTCRIMEDNQVRKIPIQNIDSIDWDAFDTLIISHLEELSSLINRSELREEIVQKALEHGKNIFSLDDITDMVPEEMRDRVYCPKVDESVLPPWRFGKLFRISKPVLGVFGTSSKQGKFTLQLKLREILTKKGVRVGQMGTEPTALLYGMDYVYPMGYNSSVYIKEFDAVRYINYLMRQIEAKENDMIIVGSQSGTVAYDNGNIALYNIPQYNYILGTQPDRVVLCVNPYDDMEYIEKTIKFIESCIDCTVIALVIFPMGLANDWSGIYGKKIRMEETEIAKFKEQLVKSFQRPCFVLGTPEIEELSDYIIEKYTAKDV